MESRFIGLGRRRAETDSVLPFTDACVRSSAVRPQLQNRRNDPDVTDVYRKYVGGSQKHPTHTIVPEARYQIQMLADKELRESSQDNDSKQTAARQNVAFDSSEQWGPSFFKADLIITIRSQRLISLSLSQEETYRVIK